MDKLINLREARKSTLEKFYDNLEDSNKLWYGVIRLIITLSSSFLVLTLALVEKLFPEVKDLGIGGLSLFVIFAWILFSVAIVVGIIAEIRDAIFHGNLAKEKGKFLIDCDTKLAQGIERDAVEIPESYVVEAPIFWGVISINSFVMAVFLLSLSLLRKIIHSYISYLIVAIIVICLVVLNFHLISKREK